ncbi:hypothetical protein KVP10_20810, partial [Candidimonas humi]
MNTSRIPKIESTGDIGIRSIKLVLRKNKFNEYRLSPVHEEEPMASDMAKEGVPSGLPVLLRNGTSFPKLSAHKYLDGSHIT